MILLSFTKDYTRTLELLVRTGMLALQHMRVCGNNGMQTCKGRHNDVKPLFKVVMQRIKRYLQQRKGYLQQTKKGFRGAIFTSFVLFTCHQSSCLKDYIFNIDANICHL